jgi:hypothetical protein
MIMLDGKKPAAEGVVYHAFNLLSEKTKDDPLKVFKEALENIKPMLEVRSRRVGVRRIKSPWRFGRSAASRWDCVGWSFSLASGVKNRWKKSWPGNPGCASEARRFDQEKGRCPSHGRGQPGFRALSMVMGLFFEGVGSSTPVAFLWRTSRHI